MVEFSRFIRIERIRDIAAKTKNEALLEMCRMIEDVPEITDRSSFLDAIMERERIMSTGIGMGVAIPHAKIPSVKDFVIAIGRSREGIDFEALDDLPVNIIVLMVGPARKRSEFLNLMAAAGDIFNRPDFMARFLEADTPSDILALMSETG